jgi:UDP-N-acetylmuramoyl-L-alanyl-D-glutamate--2,6-diaminopimelate ligase
VRLSDLAAGVAPIPFDLEIAGLASDSRAVRAGYLFAALPGVKTDGRAYIDAAVAAGAVAVLGPEDMTAPPGIAALPTADPRRALARLAARFHQPAPAVIVAVTGTNGKTSVAHFTRALWTALGWRAASIGTLGVVSPDAPTTPTLTTPDPIALHQSLADLAARGIGHVAMEASSHGIDQRRLDGVTLAAAAFTNFSHEHLDYHGSLEAYFAAKARLFDTLLPSGGTAVINADPDNLAPIAAIAKARGHRLIRYGAADSAELRLIARAPHPTGQTLTLELFGQRRNVDLPLVGAFQADNALAALGLAIGAGADQEKALRCLANLPAAPGRLQWVASTPSGGAVYVDYAHKAEALETVLSTLRPFTAGRLWVVFGCGGDRDRAKRPMMGAIASRLADHVIVTDDNPRSEDPAAIRAAVMAACGPNAREIGDRASAIAEAVATLDHGDVLVIAGKGHEQGQIIGSVTRPFDDATQARAAVSALEGCAA